VTVFQDKTAIAFSSEVDTGSREENAPKQKIRASVLIQSEPKRLWITNDDDASAGGASGGVAIPNAGGASGGDAIPNVGDDPSDGARDGPSAPVPA
jgi:hypothetical protein